VKFSGVLTALVTPFKKGKLDLGSLKKLVHHQIENGIQGFVVNGTTAESPTLEPQEVEKIFAVVKKESDGSVPLVLGVGSNSTKKTIANLKIAQRLKADAVLVVVPYYNKPTQAGMLAHFREVAKASKLPVILYNVPGRTVVSMAPETVSALARVKNIVGIKEASGKMDQLEAIQKSVSSKFLLSSGDDGSAVDFAVRGGHGVISVISHVIPREFVEFIRRGREKDAMAAGDYEKYSELNALMGIESNPIPVKMALHLMGIIDSPELRLPLVQLTKENKEKLQRELSRLGVV
jgi:4-hydroxy-tetrahydrodipicolinate synthase